jgi:uracil-DNA glycosylase family 4
MSANMSVAVLECAPGRDCPLCPRLVGFRQDNRQAHGDWHNAPVPAFGPLDARLLIVGLAPGLRGANATGRPFTGDWAGDLLYATLLQHGAATGHYEERADDGLALVDCRITNAVRCVPPANRPTPAEAAACRPFLVAEIASMPRLQAILSIGGFAHDAVLTARGLRKSQFPFAHGAVHALPYGLTMIDSYHCSRLNTNTGRLTEAMFHQVFVTALAALHN